MERGFVMSKPKLGKIEEIMEKGKNFTITRAQYINYTGADIPQDKNYTKKRSAIAKMARLYGYDIEVIPETLSFKKL